MQLIFRYVLLRRYARKYDTRAHHRNVRRRSDTGFLWHGNRFPFDSRWTACLFVARKIMRLNDALPISRNEIAVEARVWKYCHSGWTDILPFMRVKFSLKLKEWILSSCKCKCFSRSNWNDEFVVFRYSRILIWCCAIRQICSSISQEFIRRFMGEFALHTSEMSLRVTWLSTLPFDWNFTQRNADGGNNS